MGRFVEGEDRRQSLLLPESLDDYVTEDNPVRVVEAFIDELDLGVLGFEGVMPAATGRPAYHPSTLLKIYLYGYLNRIQSSRRLEREAQRNIELIWLTGRLEPDFTTISNFRRENGPAIRAVCAQFIELCRRQAWFDAQLDLDPERLVFIDETWASTKMARTHGRAVRGQRLRMSVPHGHWKTTTFVAGLRLTGMVAPMVLDGPINREAFEAYVQQFLVPDRIRQILLNLMSNAIKFTDTGIVRLDVRPAADGIIFSVIDQGGAKSPFPAASASDPNSISGSL